MSDDKIDEISARVREVIGQSETPLPPAVTELAKAGILSDDLDILTNDSENSAAIKLVFRLFQVLLREQKRTATWRDRTMKLGYGILVLLTLTMLEFFARGAYGSLIYP